MPTALDAVDSDTSMPLALRLLDGVKGTVTVCTHNVYASILRHRRDTLRSRAANASRRTQEICTRNVSKDYGQGIGDEFQTGPGSQRRRATAKSRGRSFRNDATWPTISGGTRPSGLVGHF